MENGLILYLADDHHVVRKGLARLLKSFRRVAEVQEASNGKDLLDLVKTKTPHVAIVDIEMPVLNGIEAAKQIIQNYPTVKVLILTMHTEAVFVSRLADYGVHGYVSKSAQPEEVEQAIYSVLDQDFYVNRLLNSAKNTGQSRLECPEERLSQRELEVLLLICQELTPGEISKKLNISEKTYFNHRANLLRKVRARNNVGLVLFAKSNRYVDN